MENGHQRFLFGVKIDGKNWRAQDYCVFYSENGLSFGRTNDRMALDGIATIKGLNFDLSARRLNVIHEGASDLITAKLVPLKLGAKILSSNTANEVEAAILGPPSSNDAAETRVLKVVFIINAGMFVTELIAGWIAESTGLLADSLDMFADAAVFAMSLYAVGKAISYKKRAARISGYLQMALALGAFLEIVRRFIYGSEPEAKIMIVVAAIALIANAGCMWMLAKHRNGEVHMQASWIFLTNDVIANATVIVAALLVTFTGSHIPDLVTGAFIGSIVLAGSLKILRAART